MADILTNLSLHWKLDEASGSVATDFSGQGNTGTLGGTRIAGVVGSGALRCTASGGVQQFNSLNATAPAQNFSFGFWCRASAYPSGTDAGTATNHVIDDFGDTDIFWTASGWVFHDQEDTGSPSTAAPVPADGQWHHVCFTCVANGTFKTYVDGALSKSDANVTGGKFMDGLNITYSTDVGVTWDVDDIRFYSARVLALADVAALYALRPVVHGPPAFGSISSSVSSPILQSLGGAFDEDDE